MKIVEGHNIGGIAYWVRHWGQWYWVGVTGDWYRGVKPPRNQMGDLNSDTGQDDDKNT